MPVGPAAGETRTRKGPAAWIAALRPEQWIKNLVVLAALVFSHRAGEPDALAAAGLAFFVFCLLASAGYLVNDVLDRERDRAHPKKRFRPVASGALAPGVALVLAAALAAAGLCLATRVRPPGPVIVAPFPLVAGSYLLLTLSYSCWLSRVALVDVCTIAVGFLLRAVAGGVAVGVEVSSWLLLATFFLAFLLALGKRRSELVQHAAAAGGRRALRGYDATTLNVLLAAATGIVLLSYALYTVDDRTVRMVGDRGLFATLPVVVYGVARYLTLALRDGSTEDPARLLLRDRPLLASVLIWAAVVGVVLYH